MFSKKEIALRKKYIAIFLVIALLSTMLSGCDAIAVFSNIVLKGIDAEETTAIVQENEITNQELESGEVSEIVADEVSELVTDEVFQQNDTLNLYDNQWKQAYTEYIQTTLSKELWEGYSLIYLDDNEVPELVAFGSCEAQGNLICYFSDGSVQSTRLARLGFNYIERENLLCNSDGHMDYYFDIIYSLLDGELTQLSAGFWGELSDSEHQFDSEGNLVYHYSWDGVTVLEDEYSQCLKSIFDDTRATSVFSLQLYSVDEIVQIIEAL